MKSGNALLLVIVLFGCTAKDPSDRIDHGLEVLEATVIMTEQGAVIKGTIFNSSSRTYSYSEIDITLVDPLGRPIAPASASRKDLKPKETWCWTVPTTCENVADFEIVRVLAR